MDPAIAASHDAAQDHAATQIIGCPAEHATTGTCGFSTPTQPPRA